jgi:hypothetical protein
MTAATATYTFENVSGRILQISIKPSGTSTDFKVYTQPAGVNYYILGAAAAVVSVLAAGQAFYPVSTRCLANGTALSSAANIHDTFSVAREDIVVAVSNGANAETFRVVITVEE